MTTRNLKSQKKGKKASSSASSADFIFTQPVLDPGISYSPVDLDWVHQASGGKASSSASSADFSFPQLAIDPGISYSQVDWGHQASGKKASSSASSADFPFIQPVLQVDPGISYSQPELGHQASPISPPDSFKFSFPPGPPEPEPEETHAGINRISDMNEDILNLIFEHFDLQPGSPSIVQTRKDLLSAAKTCKAFVEPALNSLWRVLPSLFPLLLLLPSAEVRKHHYFVDKLPLNNWKRFDIHAPRVRSLYLEPFNMIISPHVYLRIRSLRHRDAPLLPGLKEIYIPDDLNTSLDFSSALLLASDSSLSSIHLDNSATSDRQFCIPFLFLLSVNSPNLTHLTLCGTVDMSLELVPRFRSLQNLDLRLSGTYLSSRFIQDLGKLDNLLDLTLDTSHSPIEALTTQPLAKQFDPTPSHSTFLQLRKLHILGIPSSISRVLDDMHVLMNLTTLLIHEKTDDLGRHTESSWKRCFAIISTFPAIEDIQITQIEHSPWRNHYCLSTSCFYPLYQLNNVTSFVIRNGTLSGSDEDFRFLACAFPKMTKFVEPSAEYREGRTLACLLHFSQANRHLQELKISLAALDISDNLKAINVIGRPIIQDHQHPLESLHISSKFGSLDLPDMIQVAQFLDLIFPNLSILKAYSSDTYEVSSWTKIQQIRVALQASRIKASSATKVK